MTSAEIAALPIEQRRSMAIREKFTGMGEVQIVLHYCTSNDEFILKPREEAILKRWEFAKAQFLERKGYTAVRDALMEEFGISLNAARVDIKNMREAFGQVDEVPKILKRQIAERMSIQAFEKAQETGDANAMARATMAYIKANNLDKDDPETFDVRKLMEDKVFVTVLDPQVRSLMMNLIEQTGGVTDVSKLFETVYSARNGEYTDYEAIPDAAAPDADNE
jgi:hypothetical protein